MLNPRVRVYAIEASTSQYYSHVYLDLRKKGTPIPTNDMWIAATALEHGLFLCTHSKHFEHIENLLVCDRLSNFLP